MKYLILVCFGAAILAAQESPGQREVKHHFDLAAIRAAANFRSADSIEAHLHEDGAVLHPRLAALRMRIEAGLSEARYEMDQHDYPAAEEALQRTEALLDRFAKEIGGY
jgi:ElaB/YqjD/DUF883 family membrane-anchored ribosome-binding protein